VQKGFVEMETTDSVEAATGYYWGLRNKPHPHHTNRTWVEIVSALYTARVHPDRVMEKCGFIMFKTSSIYTICAVYSLEVADSNFSVFFSNEITQTKISKYYLIKLSRDWRAKFLTLGLSTGWLQKNLNSKLFHFVVICWAIALIARKFSS
jgi:hypothetical protein